MQSEVKIEHEVVELDPATATQSATGDKYFSQLYFKDLDISEQTKKAILDLGFEKATEI